MDARVYLRLAWRCCIETVPPLQYSHTAAELSARLTQLQTAAGAMFDLSVAITRAGLLQRRLVQLEEAFAADPARADWRVRSEEHTSELQSRGQLVCRLLLEKNK